MPISREEAEALAKLVRTLRPSWDYAGIFATLKECAHRPEPAEVIAQALLRCTMDRDEARTPRALLARPSYWNLDQPLDYARPRLTPEHECPRHPGQWRATCSSCNGEAKGGNAWYDTDGPTPPPPADYDPTTGGRGLAELRAKEARAAAARGRARFLEAHPERARELAARHTPRTLAEPDNPDAE